MRRCALTVPTDSCLTAAEAAVIFDTVFVTAADNATLTLTLTLTLALT